jgi:hypothetical protein
MLMMLMMVPISEADQTQVVAGAGPSTKIVHSFFESFSKQSAAKGYHFRVPPESVKHAGGIKASDHYLFGRTGRPLNSREKDLNKAEIILAKIPISFAVGEGVVVPAINLLQLEKIITGEYKNWNQLAGKDKKIILIGREPTESVFTILKSSHNFFKAPVFSKVFYKDHEVVKYLQNPKGRYAMGFGARPNFEKVKGLRILPVENFNAGISVGLVYDRSNSDHPLVQSAIKYSKTDSWKNTLTDLGYLNFDK